MAYTVQQIARALGARFEGNGNIPITGAAEPATATADTLALAMDPKYAAGFARGGARAAMLWEGADWRKLGLEAAIFVPRARYAMSGLTHLMDRGPEVVPGVHQSAIVDDSAKIGAGAAIGPFVVIGRNVQIGANARIAPHVSIAENSSIGDNALIHAGARIGARVTIGDNFIAQPNCAIGADGFSFVTPEKSGAEKVRETLGDQGEVTAQSWTRIHSLGGVTIGDDVEIGANTTIDRGTIRDTRIGRGTKIDNLVQVAHNVEIGEDCLLCGLVGIAGSTRIGNRAVFAGQAGVGDNLFVGDDVIATAATKILSNAPAGRVLMGYPAVKMDQNINMNKALRRLPRLNDKFEKLQKAVSKLTGSD